MPSIPQLSLHDQVFVDFDFFKDFENEFSAIVYNDVQTSKSDLLTEPILNHQHIDEFDDETSLPEYDEKEQNVLHFNDLFPFNIISSDDLKSKKVIDNNEIDIIQVYGSPTSEKGIRFIRMVMEHCDEVGVVVFTSQDWGRQGTIGLGAYLEFLSTLRFGEMDLHGILEGHFDRWRFLGTSPGIRYLLKDKNKAKTEHRIGKSVKDRIIFLKTRDPVLRLCHRMMAHSIAGRSQAPEKVTVTDLFYLRGLDVGSVNIPYLLARYLRRFAVRRKSGAHISGGQFVARLAKHFGLLTDEILEGLTVISPELQMIDMAELVRLQICMQVVPIVDEGGQGVLAPIHAPQQPPPPPPAPAKTMPKRMARLEEDVDEIREGIETSSCEGKSDLYTVFSEPYALPKARQTEDWCWELLM
ncbi:hypothetical protein Tco_1081516 [Tanacetum coccineum]|uniref:Uncharacterized protein n=1 Tax=Tanacetum coccineum TaxID=301880 RepID=A0ABQ5HXM3_9ASTR